jgi:hypothetical protein
VGLPSLLQTTAASSVHHLPSAQGIQHDGCNQGTHRGDVDCQGVSRSLGIGLAADFNRTTI